MAHYPQARMDTRLMRDMVRSRGDWVDWHRGAPCPCGDERQGTDPSCQACSGSGFVYPLPALRIRGIVTSVEHQKNLIATGLALPGDMTFSQAPGPERYVIQEWDKIVPLHFVDGQPYPGDRITRGYGAADQLRWPAISVQLCLRVDPYTGTSELYQYGTDFTIQGRALTWVGQHQPPAGEQYSVKYRPLYEYVAFNSPILRYERATSLGQRVLMRKRHLALSQLQTGDL